MPQDPGAHYAYGLWALMNHREEIAIAAERRALALSPADDLLKVQAQTFIGLGEDALKRPERAEAAFRAALAENRKPPNPNPNPSRGSCAAIWKGRERAEAAFRAALAETRKPPNPNPSAALEFGFGSLRFS